MSTTTPTGEKEFPEDEKFKLPRPFILRRLHSLLGVWLVIYLVEHLLVNSQAALFIEDDGHSFVRMVNQIHQLPFLPVIEIVFLGLPFLIHGIWGIIYLRTYKGNALRGNGTRPALPQYKRNRAYGWQRITSWILVVGIVAHVIHMRFVDYPAKTYQGMEKIYMARLAFDPGLYAAAEKLGVELYDKAELMQKRQELEAQIQRLNSLSPPTEEYYLLQERVSEDEEWLEAAEKKPLKSDQILAVAPSAGAAFLLIVRDTFKSPLMVILYSLLVVAASYHAFNGLWTFLISWGITLTRRSQRIFRKITTVLMLLVIFLGLMSAWGTWWITRGFS